MGDKLRYKQILGVVPILQTPFDHQGRIDSESLRKVVEFNIVAGVDGLGIALGSEIPRLREEERDLVLTTVVDQTNGRIPIVMNTGGAGTDLAVFYSRRAEELGADAAMVTPPPGADAGGVLKFFRDIEASVDISVVIQDVAFAPVDPTLVSKIFEECTGVVSCKMETSPTPPRISNTIEATQGAINVLGGAGANFLIEELSRGSDGTMPFSTTPSEFVEICALYRSGKTEEAITLYNTRIGPICQLNQQIPGIALRVHKEILKKRGLIETARVLEPLPVIDEFTRREIDALLEHVIV